MVIIWLMNGEIMTWWARVFNFIFVTTISSHPLSQVSCYIV